MTTMARREPRLASPRYKIKFPDAASYAAATALELIDLPVAVASAKRRYFTLSIPAAYAGVAGLERALEDRLEFYAEAFGAEVSPDYRWDLDLPPASEPEGVKTGGPSLDDVLTLNRAREAWPLAEGGAGATIAVVDTGVSGRRRELSPERRRGSWQIAGTKPWSDPVGHGTMCAVIAAGSRAAGGRFDGVAPEAGLIACRTRFFDSELAAIYDYLTDLVRRDPTLKLIATNSFGRRHGSPPPPPSAEFPAALDEAVNAGMAVFFSAGNNHDLAGGHRDNCHPSTIWHYKLRPDVFTVGACDLRGELWDYSSRVRPGRVGEPSSQIWWRRCRVRDWWPSVIRIDGSPSAGAPAEPAPKRRASRRSCGRPSPI